MNDNKRKERLQTLIKSMEDGNTVDNRDLKNALTDEEWSYYEQSVEQDREYKAKLYETPKRLKRYVGLLKKADFSYAKAEKMYPKGNPITRSNCYYKSQSECEQAIECLRDVLAIQPDVRAWLDRDFDGSCSAHIHELPRLITSTSCHNQKLGEIVGQRARLKLSAMRSSLQNLQSDNAPHDEAVGEFKLPDQRRNRHIDTSGINFD